MAHLNIYVSNQTEKKIRKLAKKTHKSVSAYIGDLIESALGENNSKNGWSQEFIKLISGPGEGVDLEEPVDSPPESIKPLKGK